MADPMAELLDGMTLRRDQGRGGTEDEYAPKFWDSADGNREAKQKVQDLNRTLANLHMNRGWFCYKELRQTATGTTYWIMLRKLRTAPPRSEAA